MKLMISPHICKGNAIIPIVTLEESGEGSNTDYALRIRLFLCLKLINYPSHVYRP